ncbi:MAG: hypothetical protein ACE5HB_03400 [Terriglobia bacterium]
MGPLCPPWCMNPLTLAVAAGFFAGFAALALPAVGYGLYRLGRRLLKK